MCVCVYTYIHICIHIHNPDSELFIGVYSSIISTKVFVFFKITTTLSYTLTFHKASFPCLLQLSVTIFVPHKFKNKIRKFPPKTIWRFYWNYIEY